MSVVVVMMVMMPIMMMMVMVVPIVVMMMMMVVMVPMMMVMMVMMMMVIIRQLHAFFSAGASIRLPLSVEHRQNGDRIGNRLQQFSYAGGAQGLIGFL